MTKFGEWWNVDGDDGSAPAVDLPWCPDGENVAKITKAEMKDLKFKQEDRNPTGRSLVVTLEVTGFRPVEAIASVTWRGLIEAICRSASVHVPDPNEEWDEQQLVGQFCRVETVQGVSAKGREYVRVEKWIAGRDPLPKAIAKAPPRARAAAAKPTSSDPDDIPF